MKTVYKGIVSALTAAILLSLCLTPTAFATEEWTVATPSDAEEKDEEELLMATPSDVVEDEEELFAATPSDAEDEDELITATPSDAGEVELLTASFFSAVEDTVSTGEELMEWLSSHKYAGGAVKLTDDIILGDFYYDRGMRAEAVTIDTGEFTIAVEGYVYLQAPGTMTIRGVGGEQGLLRTSGVGGMLHLYGIALEAEIGYAVFQEEGSGLILDILDNTSIFGEIHYAEQPFAWEWLPAPAQVVVERGETLDAGMLPATLSVVVNRQGQNIYPYTEVPVTWDLSGHGEDQKLRRRFTVSGEFEGMASQAAPECTVVYDDFPLTFLDVNVRKIGGRNGDSYNFSGTFSIPEDRLPITVSQEYSFDGQDWTVYEENPVTTPGPRFMILLFVGTEDLEKVSELFIRLRWDDDGTVYYSNVLRFATDSLLANEEPGGNRGGGTDIVDPPGPPEPETPDPEIPPPPITPDPEIPPPPVTPDPETPPPPVTSEPSPGHSGNSGSDHGSDGGGEAAPPESESSDGIPGNGGGPLGGITQGPGLPGGSSAQEAAPPVSGKEGVPPISAPEAAPGPGTLSEPEPPNEGAVSSRASSAPVSEPSESSAHIAAAKEETPEAAVPVTIPETPSASDGGAAPPYGEAAEVSAKPESEITPPTEPQPEPDVLPVAAGLAAITVSIGGAALYLHPKAWKTLLRMLRNLIRR